MTTKPVKKPKTFGYETPDTAKKAQASSTATLKEALAKIGAASTLKKGK